MWTGVSCSLRLSWCVCVGLGSACTPPSSCSGVGACGLLRSPRPFPATFWWGCLWGRGCAEVAGGGFYHPPAPPLFFFGLQSACVVFGPVVSRLSGVGRCPSRSWVSWSPSPLPLFAWAAPMSLFSFFSARHFSILGVCRRVQGVILSGGPVWQGSPPVFFRGAPWVSPSVLPGWWVRPPLVEWVRGFVAVCLSLAPPLFFLPCCLFVAVGSPAPWVRWVMYTLGLVAFPVGLGSGFAGWAVAPGGG